MFFERLFRNMSFGRCLVAQSCSQLAYSVRDTSHKNVIWIFRITNHYVIQSQKFWALNEHGPISEMEHLLCSSFWVRCGLPQEWFEWNGLIHFHACTLNLPGAIWFEVLNSISSISLVTAGGKGGCLRVHRWPDLPLCVSTDFTANPRLTCSIGT